MQMRPVSFPLCKWCIIIISKNYENISESLASYNYSGEKSHNYREERRESTKKPDKFMYIRLITSILDR